MKHLLLIGFISLTGLAAKAGPTCAEYFKYMAQGIDWPYALPMSDFAEQCHKIGPIAKWPSIQGCPEPQNHLAVVEELGTGTNNTVYCKVNVPSLKATEYIDCTNTIAKINSLVLITEAYDEMWDKVGNISCSKNTFLVKVISK